MREPGRTRNFSIIAHIDHGKSTLADRMIEICGGIPERVMRAQVLDDMDLERERGITIKSHPITLDYGPYRLNLIDTPGHVDFRYEVSRSLAACEGALLVVDASQGIQAQTLAHLEPARDEGLAIIPVINKIDIKGVNPEIAEDEIVDLGFSRDEILRVSAKSGTNVERLLDEIVSRIPPPKGAVDGPARALIFDSIYDPYLGAVAYIRVVDGEISRGGEIILSSTGFEGSVGEIGIFAPERRPEGKLTCGGVGYLTAGIKDIRELKVGDTIISAENPDTPPLPGYKDPLPMVFAGLYPVEGDRFEDLRNALERLRLNDAALTYEPETSAALGFGFRCGFLGLLHMEIVQERLEREFDLELVTTAPSVRYRVNLLAGGVIDVENPAGLPPSGEIESIEEPVLEARIFAMEENIGAVCELAGERRGEFLDLSYTGKGRVMIKYLLPLSEIAIDFHDKLKSGTRGYASLDYIPRGYRREDLVRLDIRVNEDLVDAFSTVVHRERAFRRGKELCRRLVKMIPRQQFAVPVQASVGSKIIARETIKAMGKNVTAKCYGGDITRKRKLWAKQKEGKKRLKKVGRVAIPQEAFLAVLREG